MKSFMLSYQGKILNEFKAMNYAQAKEKALEIVDLQEVEEEEVLAEKALDAITEDDEPESLREKFWETLEELPMSKYLEYLWMNWGDIMTDMVREWDDDQLRLEIESIKEMMETKK